MRAAACVGRIGGLAVFFGVGLAVGGVGTAWATPSDSLAGVGSAASTASAAPRPVVRSSGVTARMASAKVSVGQGASGANAVPGVSAVSMPTAGMVSAVEAVPPTDAVASVRASLSGTGPLIPATESVSSAVFAATRREMGVGDTAGSSSVTTTARPLVTFEAGAAASVNASAVGAAPSAGGSTAAPIVTKTIVVGSGAGAIAASPDGKYIYVANKQDSSISVISAVTNTVAATIKLPAKSNPTGIAVSPDGKTIYVANQGTYTMSIINAASNTVTNSVFTGAYSNPSNVLVSPDGATVYVNNLGTGSPYWPTTVSVIDAATKTVTKTIGPTGRVLSLAVAGFSPDGKTTYVVDTYNDIKTVDHPIQVGVLNTATGAITSPVTIAYGKVGGVVINPVTGYIYAGVQSNAGYPPSLVVINPATMKLTTSISTPVAQGSSVYAPRGVAVSSDGKSVFVTNVNANSISVINPATGTITSTVSVGKYPTGIAVAPTGGNIYITNPGLGTGNTVSVIRTT